MSICLRKCLFGFVLLCSACSQQITLHSTPISLKQTAVISTPARYFVDRINTPILYQNQLGKKRNFAGQFLAWIETDSDLSAWAEQEWSSFLMRHGAVIVPRRSEADFNVVCDVLFISVDKKNHVSGDDTFFADLKLKIKIKHLPDNATVYDNTFSTRFNTERPSEQEASMPDDRMLNYCLSMVFQKALEQIRLSQ